MLNIHVRNFATKTSTMVRILNVAEKNDAAKSLSDIMSRGGYRKVDIPNFYSLEYIKDSWITFCSSSFAKKV